MNRFPCGWSLIPACVVGLLLWFGIIWPALAETVQLGWNMPTTREDGTPITPGEVASYTAYINDVESVADIPGADTLLIIALQSGDQILTMTTIDIDGRESMPSNAVLLSGIDSDGDGTRDLLDNCIHVSNAEQEDTDGDGYGNICDGDLDNSGGVVNFGDLTLFQNAFGTVNADADFDSSGGVVNFADLTLFQALFGNPVGPKGELP